MPPVAQPRQPKGSFAMVGSGHLTVVQEDGIVTITGPSSFVLSLDRDNARLLAAQLVQAAEGDATGS